MSTRTQHAAHSGPAAGLLTPIKKEDEDEILSALNHSFDVDTSLEREMHRVALNDSAPTTPERRMAGGRGARGAAASVADAAGGIEAGGMCNPVAAIDSPAAGGRSPLQPYDDNRSAAAAAHSEAKGKARVSDAAVPAHLAADVVDPMSPLVEARPRAAGHTAGCCAHGDAQTSAASSSASSLTSLAFRTPVKQLLPASAEGAPPSTGTTRVIRELLEQDARELQEYQQMTNSRTFSCGRCEEEHDLSNLYFLDRCAHRFCVPCLRDVCLQNSVRAGRKPDVPCPDPSCTRTIAYQDIQDLLSPVEFDSLVQSSVQHMIDSVGSFIRCPNALCHNVIEKVDHSPTRRQVAAVPKLDMEGRPLSEEAVLHRADHRFMCYECKTEFCASCNEAPYHLGFTCEQFRQFKKARHCRFCNVVLGSSNTAKPTGLRTPLALQNCCTSDECLKRRSTACVRTLKCGHFCRGIRGEKHCLGCLQDGCANSVLPMAQTAADEAQPTQSQIGEDFCTICWTEALQDAPCVRSKCGHVYHYHCLETKLANRWSGLRITFGFWDCAMCNERIEHPALEEQTTEIARLHTAVKHKALERLEYEGMKSCKELTDPASRYFKKPAELAMDRYSYYPCYKCKQPYYAGQAACDRQLEQDFDPQELICGSCTAPENVQQCELHGTEYIAYKCKFCCNLATFYCWGSTRFCSACHARASTIARLPKEKLPACSCDRKHPPNGTEWAFGCSLCLAISKF